MATATEKAHVTIPGRRTGAEHPLGRERTHRRPALALFLSLLAAQAGLTSLSPVLPRVAAEFGVSTAAAGQLRTAAGLVAGVTALLVGLYAQRFGLRRVLRAGLVVLAAGSLVSAVAPSLAVLAAGQIATGASVAMLVSAGTAAAAEWAAPEARARLLSIALIGQASAWIVGMPLVGVTAEVSWRYSIAVPVVAALAAGLALRRAPSARGQTPEAGNVRSALRSRRVAAWASGELLAFSAWGGTLVFAGAFFVEVHGSSLARTGLALGLGAVAYLPGSYLARRLAERRPRVLLAGAGLAAAVLVVLFTTLEGSFWQSVALFGLLVFLGAARALAGGTSGLTAAPEHKLAVMALRAAATQFGYLLGAAAGGLALTLGGFEALGWTYALLFVAALVPHVLVGALRRARPSAARSPRDQAEGLAAAGSC
jgi:predicted MFS family arabinose efflux permease